MHKKRSTTNLQENTTKLSFYSNVRIADCNKNDRLFSIVMYPCIQLNLLLFHHHLNLRVIKNCPQISMHRVYFDGLVL